jgi:ABC-type lipoprotein export system ATPase subunit
VARQRIALAHLILKSSSLILADEPTSALDHVDADLVIAILAEQSAHGCTRLISTHSDHIARLCDRSIALEVSGLLVQSDTQRLEGKSLESPWQDHPWLSLINCCQG